MDTYIDYYYNPETWIIPKEIEFLGGIKICNSGLKIKADFLNYSIMRFWARNGVENWSYLGLYHGSKFIQVPIEIRSLLKVLSSCGATEEGYLKGTYKLSKVKGYVNPCYRLFPEGSKEEKVKSQISDIYWDKKSKFTSKMVPGHLYASKSGDLYLCLVPEFESFSASWYYPGLRDTPVTKKYLLMITSKVMYLIDKYRPTTMEEFVDRIMGPEVRYFFYPYSPRFSGKDIGELIKGGDFFGYLFQPKNIRKATIDVLLSDEVWKTNQGVREELKKRVKDPGYWGSLDEYKKLVNELGEKV